MGTSVTPVIAKLIETPLGRVRAVARGGWLVAVTLPGEVAAPRQAISAGSGELLERLAEDLRRYFLGERVDFSSYPVDLSDQPPFRQAALRAARRIPYGEVRSYRWLAEEAGNPRAARAAGQAMRHNPIPLVIPCHRVVGANGALTGYGGGLAMKRALLTLEAARLEENR